MPSNSLFGHTRHERFDQALSGQHPVASEASPGSPSLAAVWYNGHQYPYTTVVSPTLAEDARAVLSGDADCLLGNDEVLSDVDGPYDMEQGNVNAVARQAINIPVAPLANVHPQVLAASVVPPVNNQVQHLAATGPLLCPHGCTGAFGRREEFRRHMKKHTGPFFYCTHLHCGMMFYRRDKLRDHLAKGH